MLAKNIFQVDVSLEINGRFSNSPARHLHSRVHMTCSSTCLCVYISCKIKLAPNFRKKKLKEIIVMGRLAEIAGDEASGDKSRTFVFQDEGHTLGNLLRSVIAQYPDVAFCGYTVPHPAEAKMHFRIQMKHGRAVDALRRGLEDVEKLCDHTSATFTRSWDAFKQTGGSAD